MVTLRETRQKWFVISLAWAVLGAITLLVTILLIGQPKAPVSFVSELKLLHASGNSLAFYDRAGEALRVSKEQELARILKLVRLRFQIDRDSLSVQKILGFVPDAHLKHRPSFLLLAHLYLELGTPEKTLDLYNRIAVSPDLVHQEAFLLVNKDQSLVSTDVFPGLQDGQLLSLAGYFRYLSSFFSDQTFMAWLASLEALKGNMVEAFALWPEKDYRKVYGSIMLDGYFSLANSALAMPSAYSWQSLDAYPQDMNKQAARAEQFFRQGLYSQAINLWDTVLGEKKPEYAARTWYQNARFYLNLYEKRQDHDKELASKLRKKVDSYTMAYPFPVPLADLDHEASIAALWNSFLSRDSGEPVWKSLGWFLVINRDTRNLGLLLGKIKDNKSPWFFFFTGWHALFQNDLVRAENDFLEAAGHGIPEAWQNYGLLRKLKGDTQAFDISLRKKLALERFLDPGIENEQN